MGKNLKILGEKFVKSMDQMDPNKHQLELTKGSFHFHWRNLCFYFSKEEFYRMLVVGNDALKRWQQMGFPDCKDLKEDINIGLGGASGMPLEPEVHSNYIAIEKLGDDSYQFNYKYLRKDLRKEELQNLIAVFEQTKKNLETNGGIDSRGLTTDEYLLAHDMKEFFEKIKDIDYVVMRWFEDLPNKVDIVHYDVDILTYPKNYNQFPRTKFCGADDVRVVGDGFYPAEFAETLIRGAIFKDGVKILPDQLYFDSFAYHAIYHKFLDSGIPTDIAGFNVKTIRMDYTNKLNELANKIGFGESITIENLHRYLQSKGIRPELNAPQGVIHDKELLIKFLEKVNEL